MKYIPALLADWANGIFAVLIAGYLTNTEIEWWYFLVGILLSHVPDIDAVPELLVRGKVAASAEYLRDHRTFLHYPLISLPLSGLAVVLFGYWGLVGLIALVLHLLNDLYGTGWGIQVLWPLDKRHYKLLGRRVNRLRTILVTDGDWDQLSASEGRLRFLVSWSPAELPMYITRWGDEDWISRWYGNINWVSGIEYGLACIACALVIFTLF